MEGVAVRKRTGRHIDEKTVWGFWDRVSVGADGSGQAMGGPGLGVTRSRCCGASQLAFDDLEGLGECGADAVALGGGDGDGGGVTVADETVLGVLVEVGEPLLEIALHG